MFVVLRMAVLGVFLLAGCAQRADFPPERSAAATAAAPLAAQTQAAADSGDPGAMILMGDAAASTAEALRWYCRAARQGSGPAQYKTGLAYAEGLKKSRRKREQAHGRSDMAASMAWLDAAILNGVTEARELRRRLALSAGPEDIDLYVTYSRLGAEMPCEWEEVKAPLAGMLKRVPAE